MLSRLELRQHAVHPVDDGLDSAYVAAVRGRKHTLLRKDVAMVLGLEPVRGSCVAEHLVGDRSAILEAVERHAWLPSGS